MQVNLKKKRKKEKNKEKKGLRIFFFFLLLRISYPFAGFHPLVRNDSNRYRVFARFSVQNVLERKKNPQLRTVCPQTEFFSVKAGFFSAKVHLPSFAYTFFPISYISPQLRTNVRKCKNIHALFRLGAY